MIARFYMVSLFFTAGFQQDFVKQNHFGNMLTEHSREIGHELTDSLDFLKFQ